MQEPSTHKNNLSWRQNRKWKHCNILILLVSSASSLAFGQMTIVTSVTSKHFQVESHVECFACFGEDSCIYVFHV